MFSFSIVCGNSICKQDGNGFIDKHELTVMLRCSGEPMSEDEIREIIEEADVDNDGVIDYNEFYNMMYAELHATAS